MRPLVFSAPARRFVQAALAILLLSAAWRTVMAVGLPCLSRDGVLYCWYARDIDRFGLDALHANKPAMQRAADYDQQPLTSLAILGASRVLRAAGAAESPMLWQRAGQIVSGMSGLVVVLLTGFLAAATMRAVNRADLADAAALWSMALAGLLPLNVWLSADVMSDEPHLALYLLGALALVWLGRGAPERVAGIALMAGLCAGAAFLVRPEGAVIALAAQAVLLVRLRQDRLARFALATALLWAGAFAWAFPYWLLSGQWSAKINKEAIEQFAFHSANAGTLLACGPALLAALLRERSDWYAVAPKVLYELMRGGRVVIPLLALSPLWLIRRRLLRSELIGLTVCAAVHFALLCGLLYRHGYVSQRHGLVIVSLLTVPAGATLAVMWNLPGRRRILARGATIVSLAVLAAYALRVPNGDQGFVRRAGQWLAEHDSDHATKTLMGGASQRRIAFYADTKFQAWPENTPEPSQRAAILLEYLKGQQPDYFAIDVGSGRELAGNDKLLEAALNSPDWPSRELEHFSNQRSMIHLLKRGSISGQSLPASQETIEPRPERPTQRSGQQR